MNIVIMNIENLEWESLKKVTITCRKSAEFFEYVAYDSQEAARMSKIKF